MTSCPHYAVHKDHALVSCYCHLISQDVECQGQREACEPIREIVERHRIKHLEQAGHTPHCARMQVWGDGECECDLTFNTGDH